MPTSVNGIICPIMPLPNLEMFPPCLPFSTHICAFWFFLCDNYQQYSLPISPSSPEPGPLPSIPSKSHVHFSKLWTSSKFHTSCLFCVAFISCPLTTINTDLPFAQVATAPCCLVILFLSHILSLPLDCDSF